MPYLISDPMPQAEADYFLVDIDGSTVTADAEVQGDNIRLHHDVTAVSLGSHTATVTAVNMWGDGEPSDPFVFTKALPSKVYGLGLEV